jgi:pSer/pThr/pTyr-binding forkhead associated (FHA) protein
MNPAVILLVLRIVSALVLLGFLGLIAWLIYQDLKATSALLSEGQRVRGTLTVTRDDSEPRPTITQHPLLPVTSIGRAKSNALVIEDEYASSRHALLSLRGKQWWLEDLESRNGTLLNDNPLVAPAVVTSGDVITIGSTHVRIDFQEIV